MTKADQTREMRERQTKQRTDDAAVPRAPGGPVLCTLHATVQVEVPRALGDVEPTRRKIQEALFSALPDSLGVVTSVYVAVTRTVR